MLYKKPGQQFSTAVGASLAAGIAVWIFLLLSAAANSASHFFVSIGPLRLHTVTRQETKEGLSVGITFEKGMLFYVCIWLLIGAIAGAVLAAISRRQHNDKD